MIIVPGIDDVLARSRIHERKEDIRGEYFRDQTAIIHASAFRRLKHKTQVIFAPENDHICTRIEHVLHVATVAATICRGLNQKGWQLDTELAYAAGLGHDLGHAPFGHSGERALDRCNPAGFMHELQSLRVVDHLARDGAGLNLTMGVRDAIVCHNGERLQQTLVPDTTAALPEEKKDMHRLPGTWEGCAVRIADRIAYLGRDLEDGLRANFITRSDLPEHVAQKLGEANSEILNALVLDVIENSSQEKGMGFSWQMFDLFTELSAFNFQRIYRHPLLADYEAHCMELIREIYEAFCNDFGKNGIPEIGHFNRFAEERRAFYEQEDASVEQIVTDYIAGMTDNRCLETFKALRLPTPIPFA